MSSKTLRNLIEEIAKEEGINLRYFSSQYICQLSKNGKYAYFFDNKFDLNGEAIGNIACDKYATCEILESAGVPVVRHQITYDEPKVKKEKIKKFFSENQEAIVLKPNEGFGGNDIYLCNTRERLEKYSNRLIEKYRAIVMCPYYAIQNEYRVFWVGGQCQYVYRKVRPYIIGDGIHTVQELSREVLNIDREEEKEYVPLKRIPKRGEKVELSWKFNLSKGAKADINIEESLRQELYQLAKQVTKTLPISYASIDIIEEENGTLRVIEVNSRDCGK